MAERTASPLGEVARRNDVTERFPPPPIYIILYQYQIHPNRRIFISHCHQTSLTVTVQVAVLPPSSAVAVIVAVPLPVAVTLPFASTMATFSLLEVHVTFLFVASVGLNVTVSFDVPLYWSDSAVLFSVMPSSGTVTISNVAVFVPV